MLHRLFLAAYGISGTAALIYEITWTRLLTSEMGHGIAAASTVLAAFMGGLAVGSAVGGRIGGRLTPVRALRVYAAIEVGIAALAVLLPLQLRAVRPWLASVYADGNSDVAFQFLRLTLSLLLLAIPAAAMGATFPIAARWVVGSAARAPSEAGWLYTVNTLGASAGAALAGFVLLPAFGLRRSMGVGIVLNLIAAAVAWLIASRATMSPVETQRLALASDRAKRPRRHPAKEGGGFRWTAAIAMGLSGGASLALQVIWTRLAASILGPTTYAFSAVVTVFVGGLAAGSLLGVRLAARSHQPLLGLAVCVLSSVALAAVAASGVDWALLVMAQFVTAGHFDFGSLLIRQVLLVTALIAPMAVAFGAAFPFSVAAATKLDEVVIADLGLIYAASTCGAIIGALLTGFVLIDAVGLHSAIRVVILVVAAGMLALLVAARVRGRSRAVSVGACALVAAAGLALPAWNQQLLASGVYKYASEVPGADLDTWLTSGRLLYYREGATATVSVRESLGTRSLSIDGKVDASNRADMLTQRLLAHLPLLLHPDPRRVAILGLGSGVTAGAALKHPITGVDVLEISPEVVEASRAFESENHRALADPRLHLIVGDGRLHLRLTRSQYDVIVSEPSNPWIAGVASLFTREFFELARDRLAPDGVLCQWAHTYDMSDEDLRSIVATFLSVFPDGALWQIGEGDVLLIGAAESLDHRLNEIARHWTRPGVVDDLKDVGASEPFDLLSMFVAAGPTLAAYARGAVIQSDDRSELEFTGPRSTFGGALNRNDETLRQLARSGQAPPAVQEALDNVEPASWRNRGWMLLKAEVHETAWRDFVRAIETDPTDADAYEGLMQASIPGATPGVSEALTLLRRLAADDAHFEAKVALSRLVAATGNAQEALAILFDLNRRHPDNPKVLEQLASVLSDMGDTERLPAVVATLRRIAPGTPGTRYHTAALLFQQGRPDLAVPEIEPVVRDNPGHALAQNVLGVALASVGQSGRAREAFEASLRANPFSSRPYASLGALEMEAGRPAEAARRFAESLLIDPGSEVARRGLAEARASVSK